MPQKKGAIAGTLLLSIHTAKMKLFYNRRFGPGWIRGNFV